MESAAVKDIQQPECPLEYPPCKVCGGAGAGKHYGVYTCQSCKTFFRRYLKREKPYVCPRNGDCKVVSSSRGNCSACRVQKCKQVGMSVEGVKIGRRTLKERNKTIHEVNEMQIEKKKSQTRFEILRTEAQRRMEELLKDRPELAGFIPWCKKSDHGTCSLTRCGEYEGTPGETAAPSVPELSSMPINNIFYLSVQEALMSSSPSVNDQVYLDGSDSSMFGSDQDSCQKDTDDNCLLKLLEESENSSSLPNMTDITDDNSEMDLCPLSPGSLEECFTELMEWTDQESQNFNQRSNLQQGQLPDDAIQDLVDSFKEMKVHPNLTDDEIKKKLREEYEKIQLVTSAIGPMRPMTNEEYMDFVLTTGLDLEGRAKHFMYMRTNITIYLKRVTKFAHKIPGFRDLLPKDQASLIRAATFEVQVLLMNRAVDPDLEMWMVSCGDVLDVNQSWMFGNMETRKKWFSLAKDIRSLNLSTEEMAVVMGMSLTFTDRCSLCRPEEVDIINLNLMNHLQKMLQSRYQDKANNQLCKIMELFVNLRTFSHERDTQIRQFLTNKIVRMNFPHIGRLLEIISE